MQHAKIGCFISAFFRNRERFFFFFWGKERLLALLVLKWRKKIFYQPKHKKVCHINGAKTKSFINQVRVKCHLTSIHISKSYFIYFNIQFHNILCINSLIFTINQTLIFLLISFSLPLSTPSPRNPTKEIK